ncbi:MAG TPA: RsmB/NOP family class I SAM-dependent RNA methyltransferase [Candidatus Paceibacterota bacterium]|nr:RsmB/NOP family class I SAM-dependent RNA methyltransferase [Candidatus Paceibacterota bacterium]
MYEPKQEFIERMKKLLPNEEDFEKYWEISKVRPVNSIRVNTLKISVEELKKRLEKKWKIKQPFNEFPEVFIIENELAPGELGKAIEHLLGYYYVQEISSMTSLLVLKPQPGDIFLDLCASPGSKTTQAAAMMKNSGLVIANEVSLGRIMILSTNLQRCGVTNTIITQSDGSVFFRKIKKSNMKFDKVLVDAPCSGEGTIRSSPKTLVMFSEHLIKTLSGKQKSLARNGLEALKIGGEMIYSTCTHAPEENEEIVSYLLDNFPVEIEDINLPLNTRPGIIEWNGKKYNPQVEKCVRIYPQDNNTEGFFVAKLRKIGEVEEREFGVKN